MIDDDAEYEARRQIRAQADADVAAFIASLDQDEGSGIPTPSRITISEVSTKPVKFNPFAFGQEGAGTAPIPPIPPHCVVCPVDQTSGDLIIGATYTIWSYVAGDDFTNVGAGSNADGIVFVATGTTPAVWSNGSTLKISVLVTVSGISLCGCVDTLNGASFSVIDGHYPGGTDTGVNALYLVNADVVGWQRELSNFTPTDPFFYWEDYDDSFCTVPGGFNLAPMIISVLCTDPDTWLVEITKSGYWAFRGTGCGSSGNPILNENLICDETLKQVGTGGQAVISLT